MIRTLATSLALGIVVLAANANAQDSDPQSFGCGPTDFVTATGDVSVGITGFAYTPRCLKVKAGSLVTFAASSHHPLQGVGPLNPILDPMGGATATKTVRFDLPGHYGYFCVNHGGNNGSGMTGVVWVE